jgi:hypothetical protein
MPITPMLFDMVSPKRRERCHPNPCEKRYDGSWQSQFSLRTSLGEVSVQITKTALQKL